MPFSQCVLEMALNLLNKGCKFVLKGKIPAITDKPQCHSAKKQIKCLGFDRGDKIALRQCRCE
ncbi:hypothetical protein CMQ96_08630 [Klebsiella sp. MBT K-1]|nr:hypothetical protein F0332_06130 [Klebsiella grimontii]PEN24562.1 hypothetical protein CMQ96_08630 [Klebsiella sp. MBT K-1]